MNRTVLRAVPVVAIAAAAGAMLAGSPATAKSTLHLKAVEGKGDHLSFSKKKLKTSGGKVTIAMANPRGNKFPHAIAVKGEQGKIVSAGGTSRVTVTLK